MTVDESDAADFVVLVVVVEAAKDGIERDQTFRLPHCGTNWNVVLVVAVYSWELFDRLNEPNIYIL
jgi:hypothetical protein